MREEDWTRLRRWQSQRVVGFGAEVGSSSGTLGSPWGAHSRWGPGSDPLPKCSISVGSGTGCCLHTSIVLSPAPTLILLSSPENSAQTVVSLCNSTALGSCPFIIQLCHSSSAKTLLLTFSLVLWSILCVLPEESCKRWIWPHRSPAPHPLVAPSSPEKSQLPLRGSKPLTVGSLCLCLLPRQLQSQTRSPLHLCSLLSL